MLTLPLPSPLLAATVVAAALLAPAARADPPVATAPGATPPATAPLASLASVSQAQAEEDARRLRYTSGVSLSGLGALTVLLGSVLGVRAIVAKNDIGAHCSGAGKCDLTGYTYFTEAQDFSIVSTASFILGLTAAGVGVGLLISSRPSKSSASAWIAPAPRGVVAGARW